MDGALVMGRGAAKQVRDTYPGIDKVLGDRIRCNPASVLEFVPVNEEHGQYLGWFRVKHHWKSKALLRLIERATKQLSYTAEEFPNTTYHMNFPGIGNGGLEYHSVLTIIKELPDNVLIYQ
jgi:hypothetical protein